LLLPAMTKPIDMKKYLLLLIVLLSMTSLRATHFMGGEITWECLPNGNYRFILVVYRECAGINYPNHATLTSNSPAGNIQLYLWPNNVDGREEISPRCHPDTAYMHIECANTPFGTAYSNMGALEKWTFTSDSIYPNGITINGVPPASGWYFAYTSCCRNPNSSIPGSSSKSWFLRAIMYPYQSTNTYPCFDNSPRFLGNPPVVICSGYPFNSSHQVFDPEFDSLTFEWGQALNDQANSPITNYNAGYSFSHPFPGIYHNPSNVPAYIDPYTGDISLRSFTQGAFVNVTKLSAFRSGIKIAEVFRELQTVILPCGSNAPPEFDIIGKSFITPYLFIDTVYAGDTLQANLFALDSIPVNLPYGQPASLILTANGVQFGDGFTSDTGCLIEPCATLGSAPPIVSTYALNTSFEWVVTDDHYYTPLMSSNKEPYYDFFFRVSDDFCPVPGVNNYTYRVFVLPSSFKTTSWFCQRILPQGEVELKWNRPYDPDTLFRMYRIFHKNAPTASWVVLDSLTQPGDTLYLHTPASLQSQVTTYKVEVVYEVNGHLFFRDIFESKTPLIVTPVAVCQNDFFELTTQELGGGGNSLLWDFGNFSHSSGSGTGPHWLIADSSGLHTISLEIHNACGLSHLHKEVQVHPLPDIHISGPRYYCPGTPLVLTASGGAQYSWSTGATSPSITLSSIYPPVSFQVTVTDNHYCVDTASVSIRNVIPYSNAEICMVSVDPASGRLQVLWENPAGKDVKHYRLMVRNAILPNQWMVLGNIPYHQAGLVTDSLHNPAQAQYHYALQVVDSCNNETPISTAVGTMRLQAFNASNGDIILSWMPYEGIATGHYAHLYRYAPSVGTFVFVDSVLSSLISYTDQNAPQEVLQYYASVKGMQCYDPAGNLWTEALSNTVSVDNTTGLDAPSPEDALRVFTVPAQPYIFIERAGPGLRAADILLFDVLGRQVMDIRLDAGIQQKLVPASGLANGVYYYQVRHSGGTQQGGKLVVGGL